MLTYACLLAFIGLSSSSNIEKVMPSRYEIESSINRTIEEVEKMIEENPSLPKLTRNDIVSILYNITSKDMLSIEDEALEAIQRTRQDYQRALMVVLPYKPKDAGEKLDELYTKPPIVQLIQDDKSDLTKKTEYQFTYNPSTYSANSVQPPENLVESNKHKLITAHMKVKDSEKAEKVVNEKSKLINDSKPKSEPHKFSFDLNDLDQKAEASSTYFTNKRPNMKGTFTRYRTSTQSSPKSEITYSTTLNTEITIDTTVETATVNKQPSKNILTSGQWHYNTPSYTTTLKPIKTDNSPWQPMSPSHGFFLPTVQSSVQNSEEANFEKIQKEDFEKIMETISITTVKSAPIFVTPSIVSNQKQEQSNIKAIPSGFKLTTSTQLPTPMREEVEQLLKSIGLQPMKPIEHPNNINFVQNNTDFPLQAYLNSKTQGTRPIKTEVPSTTQSSSFKVPQGTIKDVVKNLSPDIQLLFQRFGLQNPGQGEVQSVITTTYTPTNTAATINSYTHFKPLPTSSVKDKDFRNFLARFGLGTSENRNQKSIQPSKNIKRPSLIDSVPSGMRKILENIGLIKRTPKIEIDSEQHMKKIVELNINHGSEIQSEASNIVEQTTPSDEHIFKPHKTVMNDKEQNEKIQNLLNTVRMVQDGRANVQDVQRVAQDLLESTRTFSNGPDPLKLEEILNNYKGSLKNSVKRQQEKTTERPPTINNTSITVAPQITEELDETTLSSMASTDSSGSYLDPSESSTAADSNAPKTEQSSSSSSSPGKAAANPSFFDTFDPDEFLKQLNNTSSSTAAPSTSTGKTSLLDSIDIDAYLNATKTDDAPKNTNVNLSDLEDSFGGSTAAPDPVLPTKPKTGLYFLVDWNTFLEVGEDGKDKVNLRFAPKIGDRSRFISVKIP